MNIHSELNAKTPWEFACSWYQPAEVARSIACANTPSILKTDPRYIPTDIYSQEFADWLTEQYRLAMTKGIEIGIRSVKEKL